MESLWNGGIAAIQMVRAWGDWLAWPMRALSALGQAEFYLLFIPLLYWCLDVHLGQRIAIILLLSVSLNEFLKIACHQPRPYWVEPGLVALSGEANFGLPSGHAQHAFGIWGLLALQPNLARRQRAWLSAACGALIGLIGLSRIYLGVHFPSDVVLGWVLGVLLLWAFCRWEPRLRSWVSGWSIAAQVALALGASMLLFLPVTLALASLQSWQVPEVWQQNALANSGTPIDPLSPENVISMAGFSFGLATGVIWIARRGGFCVRGTPAQLGARYLIGLLGVFALWYGPRVLTSGLEGPLGILVRFVRYAGVGFWVSGAGPASFVRFRLALPGRET